VCAVTSHLPPGALPQASRPAPSSTGALPGQHSSLAVRTPLAQQPPRLSRTPHGAASQLSPLYPASHKHALAPAMQVPCPEQSFLEQKHSASCDAQNWAVVGTRTPGTDRHDAKAAGVGTPACVPPPASVVTGVETQDKLRRRTAAQLPSHEDLAWGYR
jgi:hypothetical protein